jgi:crotonobetainyl-CoA:carnitine CoA-transferase CaiB-like acyl-CoA transferase
LTTSRFSVPPSKCLAYAATKFHPRVPELGEHTAEVLERLGIYADELDALRRDGIV